MKVQSLCAQSSTLESRLIFCPPYFFGVVNGSSEFRHPDDKPRLFDGKTGGQLAANMICSAISKASATECLAMILSDANRELSKIIKETKLHRNEPETFPSASFAIVKVTDDGICVVQGGNCLMVWRMKDGTLHATSNGMYEYEKDMLCAVETSARNARGDKNKIWRDNILPFAQRYREEINAVQGGFSLFNGQLVSCGFWKNFELSREDVARLLLFTEGAVPFDWTLSPKILAKRVMADFDFLGLNKLIESSHIAFDEKRGKSKDDYPDAAVLAIEF